MKRMLLLCIAVQLVSSCVHEHHRRPKVIIEEHHKPEKIIIHEKRSKTPTIKIEEKIYHK